MTDPIHDPHAEFALLATLVAAEPEVREEVWRHVSPADFYRPTYAALAEVVAAMPTVDPTLVVTAVRAWHESQQVDAMLRLLPDLVTWPRVDEHAPLYAQTIADCSHRRALQRFGQRLTQQVESDFDVNELAVGIISEAEGLLTGSRRALEPSATVEDFCRAAVGYDWLIEGLIERGDRVMITGAEGQGKSVLLRQIAVCAASGVHPFTGARIAPLRVLLVDFENGRPHLQRQLKILLPLARSRGDFDPDRLRIESKPAGIDLAEFTDGAWFADKIAACAPDMLVVGPLYRMHTLALDKEDAARGITVALDQIRAKNGCALIVEAHAGHGFGGHRSWRPTGSSLFRRWPEFGLGLMPDEDRGTAKLVTWRGGRDERDWPSMLRRGGAGNWPWVETIAEAESGWAS